MDQKTPLELVEQFSRCVNYPRTSEGIVAFAEELQNASEYSGVPMEDIVAKCREVADRAPEYADMLGIAREIKEDRQRKEEASTDKRKEWEREFGQPSKFDVDWSPGEVHKAAREREKLLNKRLREYLGISPYHPTPSRRDLQSVSLHDRFKAMKELGYELTMEQAKYL
jgi:hypothetical protein